MLEPFVELGKGKGWVAISNQVLKLSSKLLGLHPVKFKDRDPRFFNRLIEKKKGRQSLFDRGAPPGKNGKLNSHLTIERLACGRKSDTELVNHHPKNTFQIHGRFETD